MAKPQKRRVLCCFIVMINCYRDMWKRRFALLAPLTALTSDRVSWKWDKKHQQTFSAVKKIISRKTPLSYPNCNTPFDIHTNVSNLQLGAVISQNGKPIAFYSQKLNRAQTRYMTTEKEHLAIVETLKEFKKLFLGKK